MHQYGLIMVYNNCQESSFILISLPPKLLQAVFAEAVDVEVGAQLGLELGVDVGLAQLGLAVCKCALLAVAARSGVEKALAQLRLILDVRHHRHARDVRVGRSVATIEARVVCVLPRVVVGTGWDGGVEVYFGVRGIISNVFISTVAKLLYPVILYIDIKYDGINYPSNVTFSIFRISAVFVVAKSRKMIK